MSIFSIQLFWYFNRSQTAVHPHVKSHPNSRSLDIRLLSNQLPLACERARAEDQTENVMADHYDY